MVMPSEDLFPYGSAIVLVVNLSMSLFEFPDNHGTSSRQSRVADS